MALYPRFLRTLQELTASTPRASIRLAVSGGSDSTALVALFARAREELPLDLSLGHVNHQLRGADAAADEAFCRELAHRFDLPIVVEQVATNQRRVDTGESLETAAREDRLACFRRWVREAKLFGVATGHHADDQVESLLAHLVRGSGLRGLLGMPTIRELPGSKEGFLLRPLLEFPRAALEEFRRDAKLDARWDASNASPDHSRNRIRAELLPLLESFNPAVRSALLGLSEDVVRAWPLLDPERKELPLLVGPRVAMADTSHWSAADPGLLLDRLWLALHPTTQSLTRAHRRTVAEFLAGSDGSHLDLPGGWKLERSARWLTLYRPTDDLAAVAVAEIPFDPRRPTSLPWLGLTVSVDDPPTHWPAPGASEFWIEQPERWVGSWRGTRPDDRIATAGGSLSVHELLRAGGVPGSLRDRYPVLELNGAVAWIPHYRIAATFAPPVNKKSLGRGTTLRIDGEGASPEAFMVTEAKRRER